jgi:hypothetical protein
MYEGNILKVVDWRNEANGMIRARGGTAPGNPNVSLVRSAVRQPEHRQLAQSRKGILQKQNDSLTSVNLLSEFPEHLVGRLFF